jgi:hypothetical protein
MQLEVRKSRVANSSSAQHSVHQDLATAITCCQAATHAALLDNIDTATAISELLSVLLSLAVPSGMLFVRIIAIISMTNNDDLVLWEYLQDTEGT